MERSHGVPPKVNVGESTNLAFGVTMENLLISYLMTI